jgi:hypothetical protein
VLGGAINCKECGREGKLTKTAKRCENGRKREAMRTTLRERL